MFDSYENSGADRSSSYTFNNHTSNNSNQSNTGGDNVNILEYNWPKINIPLVAVSHFIIERLRFYGDRNFLIENDSLDNRYTFNEVANDSLRMAQVLTNSGLKQGYRFAVIGFNNYEFITTLFGGLIAGGVAVPIHGSRTHEEIVKIIKERDIKFVTLATRNQNLRSTETLKKFSKALKYIISFCDDNTDANNDDSANDNNDSNTKRDDSDREYNQYISRENLTSFRRHISSHKTKNESHIGIIQSFDAKTNHCMILDTSGTYDSCAKSCVITDYNLMAQLTISSLPLTGFNWTERDIVANTTPFSHINGIIQLFAALTSGSQFILFPLYSTLSAKLLSQSIDRLSITATMLTPLMIIELVKQTKLDANLSTLKKVICTGCSMPKNIALKFVHKYQIDDFRQAYGLTEVCGFSTMEPTGSVEYECVGIPTPLTQIKIVDTDSGDALSAGGIGEICVKTPQLFGGYLSANKTIDLAIDSDGWFHTSDIGYYDRNSRLQIVDQMSEFLDYRGLHISPTALEGILVAHEAVKEVAIIGTKHKTDGQIPTAFVVLQPSVINSYEEAEQKLTDYINEHLRKQNLSLNGGLYLIDRIEKTISGKLMRRTLKNIVIETIEEYDDDSDDENFIDNNEISDTNNNNQKVTEI